MRTSKCFADRVAGKLMGDLNKLILIKRRLKYLISDFQM